jgi:hypothetical protein
MAFNLDDYETVEVRLARFISDYPDFRIDTQLVEASGTRFIVRSAIYRTYADAVPFSTGLAFEVITDRGVNSTSALENAETSSLGRSLANAGYAAKGKRASQTEMAKVIQGEQKPLTFKEKLDSRQSVKETNEPVELREPQPVSWGIGDAVNAISKANPKEPEACEHGHILKQGISKGKGKPYYGYVCKKGVDTHAKWAKQTSNGIWYFEEGYENG